MTQIIESNDSDAIKMFGDNLNAFKSKDPYVVLVGPADTGKAEWVENIIPTPNGYRRFGDLKIGDIIFSEKGLPTQINGIFPQGIKQSYKITFNDDTSINVCGEHLWLTWTKNQRDIYFNKKVFQKRGRTGNPKILTTLEIKNNINKDFSIPVTKPVIYKKQKLLIDPYVMGALIGDGHIGLKITKISSSDEFIINKVKSKLLPNHSLVKNKSRKYDYTIKSDNYKNQYTRYFYHTALKSDIKYIPKEYLTSSIEDRIELLHGLIDTDGSVDKRDGQISYYTTSKQLSKDFRELIQSLGGICKISTKIPTYTYKGEKKKGKLLYIIYIVLPPEIIPCSLPRKLEKYKPRQNSVLKKIKSVEEDGLKEMMCISVNNPTSLYLTKNYIVTHNTFTLCMKVHLFCLKYPGVRVLMTRKSLRALRDSAVITYQNVLRMTGMDQVVRTLGETRPTNFIYPMAERRENGVLYKGKSEIILAPLDVQGKALGAEYNMVYVNQPDTEGTTLAEFKLIKSRARLPTSPYRQLICDPNPAHDKHWLLLNSTNSGNPEGEWTLFNSTHKDNPKLYDHSAQDWTELGREQLKELANLPGGMRDSLFEGKWFSTAGMAFAEYWQPHKHVLFYETQEAVDLGVAKKLKDETYIDCVPQDWDSYLSLDWGHGDPFVAILFSKHPKKDLIIQHKHIYITKTDIYEVAHLTSQMISGYNIKAVIADRGRAEATVMESILGKSITTAKKGAGSVMDGMNMMIAELNSDRWKFVNLEDSLFNTPDPELVRRNLPMGYDEIPNLKKDDKTGKIANHQADHFYDALRYFMVYWIELTRGKRKNTEFVWL